MGGRRCEAVDVIEVERTNTVLYCEPWAEVVGFYRDRLGLTIVFENDWFVEFAISQGAYLSVADPARATVAPSDGRGVTLSWKVGDVVAAREALVRAGVEVGEIRFRFGSPVVDLHDPVGNRIELWS